MTTDTNNIENKKYTAKMEAVYDAAMNAFESQRIVDNNIVESFYCSLPLIDESTNNEWIDCDLEFHNNITENISTS